MAQPVGFEHHDHDTCMAQGVAAVETVCREAGLRFTPQRKRVLEILLSSHRAMGAYDILDVLRAEGQAAQPPVAYRALDFLVAHGFAHKVERLNAFIACAHPGTAHGPAFLICKACRSVAELPSTAARTALAQAAERLGFALDSTSVEALGLCPNCAPKAAS